MPCSAVTLSLGTIAAVISIALLSIAFSTDNWIRIDVRREKLKDRLAKEGSGEITQNDLESNELYFTRTKGLFRTCFPYQRPSGVQLYLSPVETYCRNIDYFMSGDSTETFTQDEMAKVHMGRAMIAMFILAFFFTFIAFWTGVAGCWRRSSGNITSTAILLLLTCLLSAGGMGLWHGVEYYETEKLQGDAYYKDWPQQLKLHSNHAYDWSYILAWIGVGWALTSAILFSAASLCLRSEDYQYGGNYGFGGGGGVYGDGANGQNMTYLMPVYPQKQGYAYSYAYPASGYPQQQGGGVPPSYPTYGNY